MRHIFTVQNFTTFLVPTLLLALLFSRSVADIITVVAGIVLLIYSIKENDWAWLKDPVILCALVLVLYCLVIVSPFADKPIDTALRSIFWFRFLLLYCILAHVLPNFSKHLTGSFVLTIFIFLIVSLDCLFQYTTGFSISGNMYSAERLTSFLDRPNIGTFLFKAMFAFASLFLAVQFLIKKSADVEVRPKHLNLYLQWLFYITWALATLMILLSGERSTTIMMICSFFILIPGFLLFDKTMRKWALLIVILTGAIVITAVSTQPNLVNRLERTKKDLGNFNTSPYGRLTYAAWVIAKDNPITGIGQKAYLANCEKILIQTRKKPPCRVHTHNAYLEWLIIAGFPGLLIYCALVLSILYYMLQGSWHQSRIVVSAIALSALSISLFPFLFSQNLLSNWPGVLTWLSIGMTTASVKINSSEG